MAFATGTANNYLDLLARVRDFLVTNGWTQIGGTAAGPITDDAQFVSLQGPGLTGDDEILVTLQPYSVAANNAYSLRLRGHTAYVAPGPSQPGADSPWTYLLTLNSPVTYWIVANGRRFVLVVKSSSRYDAMYGGFILSEHLPSDWSYPLFIGASSWTGDIAQSSDIPYHSNFWHPCASSGADNNNPTSAYLFSPIQAWVPIRNAYRTGNDPSHRETGRVSAPWSRTSRQNVRRQIDDSPWLRRGQLLALARTSGGSPDTDVPEGGTLYGSYDGVFYTPSFGATAEQEVTVAGVTYMMFPNVGRTSDGQFAAIPLE